jgi:hypothetical protein
MHALHTEAVQCTTDAACQCDVSNQEAYQPTCCGLLQYCSTSTPWRWPPGTTPWLKPCRSCHRPAPSSLSTANCTHVPPRLLLLLLLPGGLPHILLPLLPGESQLMMPLMRLLETCLVASSLSLARLYRCRQPVSSPSSTICTAHHMHVTVHVELTPAEHCWVLGVAQFADVGHACDLSRPDTHISHTA